jgi:hypothetical protein
MVTIKELVKEADPSGDYKKSIRYWEEALVKAPPSSWLLPHSFRRVSADIGKLEAETKAVAGRLYKREEIDRGEYKRLITKQIPEAFYNIYEATLDEFEKKYKVVR